MPIIRVQVPGGVFDDEATERLIAEINEASADAEQMPKDPEHRMGLIVIWEQLPVGAIRSNGSDPTSLVVPAFIWFYPPQGVLEDQHAADYVARVQRVFDDEGARLGVMVTTSVVFQEITEGRWGIGGKINHLPDFAKRAGYRHLQHLVDA
jgi:phenylpyruvate tautomerase PptA (4-oxalocrotonate tautomerase family)